MTEEWRNLIIRNPQETCLELERRDCINKKQVGKERQPTIRRASVGQELLPGPMLILGMTPDTLTLHLICWHRL